MTSEGSTPWVRFEIGCDHGCCDGEAAVYCTQCEEQEWLPSGVSVRHLMMLLHAFESKHRDCK